MITSFKALSQQTEECGNTEGVIISDFNQYINLSNNNVANGFNYSIPLTFFVTLEKGTNRYPEALDMTNIAQVIDEVNSYFTNGMQFYICDIKYIRDEEELYFDINTRQVDDINFPFDPASGELTLSRESIETLYPASNSIGIYVVNSLATRLDDNNNPVFANGISVFPSDNNSTNNGIILAANIPVRTLAHELGHFFGLLHTFDGVDIANGEYPPVPTANCATTGDFICDTPVDPGRSTNCGFTGCSSGCNAIAEDGNIYAYMPDKTNLMSYYGSCRGTFSADQLEVMLDNFLNHPSLAYLRNVPNNVCSPFDIATTGFVRRAKYDENSGKTVFDNIQVATLNLTKSGAGQFKYTDNSGNYATEPSFSYTTSTTIRLEPIKNILNDEIFNDNNGLSTSDIIKLRKHILTIEPFVSPYQLIAADASGNGIVSAFDQIQIQNVILSLGTFSTVGAWRFIPFKFLSNQSFEDSFEIDPFSAQISGLDYTGSAMANSSYMDGLNLDLGSTSNYVGESWSFMGVKVGDVNFSATVMRSSNKPASTGVFGSNIQEKYRKQHIKTDLHECLKKGSKVDITLNLENDKDIIGYQLGIKYDPNKLELKRLKRGELHSIDQISFGKKNDPELGELKVLWVEEDLLPKTIQRRKGLFILETKLLQEVCNLSDHIFLDDKVLENWLYQFDEEAVKPQLSIVIKNVESRNNDNFELTVSPNPVHNNLVFNFFLANRAIVNITLEDKNGRREKVTKNLEQGYQIISFDNLSNLSDGMLVYYFEVKDGSQNDLRSGIIIKD